MLFVLSTQGGKINASGTGTAADAIIRMAGLLMLGFGPRTAQAIATLNDALYGEGA